MAAMMTIISPTAVESKKRSKDFFWDLIRSHLLYIYSDLNIRGTYVDQEKKPNPIIVRIVLVIHNRLLHRMGYDSCDLLCSTGQPGSHVPIAMNRPIESFRDRRRTEP
jgi:hypothetical protein